MWASIWNNTPYDSLLMKMQLVQFSGLQFWNGLNQKSHYFDTAVGFRNLTPQVMNHIYIFFNLPREDKARDVL